jgi:enoyl-CoA hydratase
MDKALEMAAMMLKNAPVAIRLAKQSINEGYDLDADGAIALENKLFGQCFATKDQKEGMDAFLNKRKADFIGE